MSDLVEATEAAVKVARDAKTITDADDGVVEAMFALARKIDAWDEIVQFALEDAALVEGKRPAVPQNDNVSLPTYLRYAESLGLTPAGRAKLVEKKPEAKGGKLGRLSSVPKPA